MVQPLQLYQKSRKHLTHLQLNALAIKSRFYTTIYFFTFPLSCKEQKKAVEMNEHNNLPFLVPDLKWVIVM